MQVGRSVIRTGLEALYFSGAHHVLRPWCGGVGAILTLHHVRPARIEAFQPSRALEVTPGFLEAALLTLRRMDLETISLDEMHARLTGGDSRSRFVCITFDDGYRDNLEWAYPILKRRRVPFAIYVTSEVPDRRGCLWWRTIEHAVAARREIELEIRVTVLGHIQRGGSPIAFDRLLAHFREHPEWDAYVHPDSITVRVRWNGVGENAPLRPWTRT